MEDLTDFVTILVICLAATLLVAGDIHLKLRFLLLQILEDFVTVEINVQSYLHFKILLIFFCFCIKLALFAFKRVESHPLRKCSKTFQVRSFHPFSLGKVSFV